jgi:hypothetical protein
MATSRANVAAVLALAALIWWALPSAAYNPTSDDHVHMSNLPASMGGAVCALSGDPTYVFHNPAGVVGSGLFAFSHNHSSRHFPGTIRKKLEMDQLDDDTQAVAMKLPLGTAVMGFNFLGEQGYDYTNHPDAITATGFPNDDVTGDEHYEGYACAPLPFVRAGLAHRRSYTKNTAKDGTINFVRYGDGYLTGWQADIGWLAYGESYLKMGYDYVDGRTGRLKTARSGWALRPIGWLTLTADKETERFDSPLITPQPAGGWQVVKRRFSGCQISIPPLGRVRIGSFDGHRTLGFDWDVFGLKFFYAEVKGILNHLVGGVANWYQDVHYYGVEIQA